jgi:hypothetical protein
MPRPAPLVGVMNVRITVAKLSAIAPARARTVAERFGLQFAIAVRNAFTHRARAMGMIDKTGSAIGELNVDVVLGDET